MRAYSSLSTWSRSCERDLVWESLASQRYRSVSQLLVLLRYTNKGIGCAVNGAIDVLCGHCCSARTCIIQDASASLTCFLLRSTHRRSRHADALLFSQVGTGLRSDETRFDAQCPIQAHSMQSRTQQRMARRAHTIQRLTYVPGARSTCVLGTMKWRRC